MRNEFSDFIFWVWGDQTYVCQEIGDLLESHSTMIRTFTSLKRPQFIQHQFRFRPHTSSVRTIFVKTQPTPNPDSIKFFPGKAVLTGDNTQTIDFPSFRTAQNSPLAKSLFKLEGVKGTKDDDSLAFSSHLFCKGVFLGQDFVTVTKDRNVEWPMLKLHVYDAISIFYDSGEPVLTDEVTGSPDMIISPEDSEIVQVGFIFTQNLTLQDDQRDTRDKSQTDRSGGRRRYRL